MKEILEAVRVVEANRAFELFEKFHKEYCECKETPLGYDMWHTNFEKYKQEILSDNQEQNEGN